MKAFDFKNLKEIENRGFSNLVKIGELRKKHGCNKVPNKPGAYLVLRLGSGRPAFLSERPGEHHRNERLPFGVDELEEKWVNGPIVVYIGRSANLKKRVNQYVRSGQGKATNHQGGRAIWQIPKPQDLLISWRCCMGREDPADVECCLLKEFKKRYDELPFANWRMPRRC